MEVNAPQPEESTPRRQEDVKVDPWEFNVQAYQWAGQKVSKGKVSSRKAASEVYLQFGISLSHTTCAKAAEDECAPPIKRGKATFVPPDVESKLVNFCIAWRSLTFPIFKEELTDQVIVTQGGAKLQMKPKLETCGWKPLFSAKIRRTHVLFVFKFRKAPNIHQNPLCF